MAKMTTKEKKELEELKAFEAEQKRRVIVTLKKAGIVLLCVVLAFAFCLPSISWLLS